MEEQEIWKPIPIARFKDRYEVSNLGRIKILPSGRTFLGNMDSYGYMTLGMYKDGKVTTVGIHRLVALAFIPNPMHLPIVNHKDENKANNRVENLEWCTHRYNLNYGTSRKRHSENASKLVAMYDMDGNTEMVFPSVKEAADYVGVSDETLRKNLCRCIKCCNGKMFRYVNEIEAQKNPVAEDKAAMIYPILSFDIKPKYKGLQHWKKAFVAGYSQSAIDAVEWLLNNGIDSESISEFKKLMGIDTPELTDPAVFEEHEKLLNELEKK